ncbi:MAG: CAP domain-containing protein [Actinobacteria bacterium]|nr:CAP domain-containing protein [Actinomycetota bacterium]
MTRRLTGAAVAALLAVLVLGATPALAFDRSANEAALLKLINQARTRRGLTAVKVVRTLDKAALAHSRDMIARDYFSHSSRAGASVAARARKAGYSTSGWSSWSIGEVIALGSGSKGKVRSVFKAWMRSSGHRKVILRKSWRDVGIGCSRGTYKGVRGVCMYTVDFGRRSK